MTFYTRRAALCITLVHIQEFFWGQIAVQFIFGTAVIIIYRWKQPLDSKSATQIETLNEVITLLVLYHILCFTAFVPEPETRRIMGFSYIGSLCVLAIVHIFIMLHGTIKELFLRFKRWYRLAKRWYNRKMNPPISIEPHKYESK